MIPRRDLPYDYDVAVIGAGPAGLAAAIRLRWVKGHRGIPASVVMIDPESPGGLAAFGGCVLTGPGWAASAEEIIPRLLKDVESLNIPQLYTRATGIGRHPNEGHIYRVHLEDGASVRCHSVIIATGFRALHGEKKHFHKGLHVTYKGYSHIPSQVAQAAMESKGKGLVLIGHRHTLDLLPLLTSWVETAGRITLLLQPPVEIPLSLPPGIDIKVGVTRGYRGDQSIKAVRYEPATHTGGRSGVLRETALECGAVLVDYHAFERRPEVWDLDGLGGLHRNSRGFIPVDSLMATPLKGIFAAGDVTGRFASAAMAIGDGVCAGFSAYKFVFERKFNQEPSLFAYAPMGKPPAAYLDGRLRERPFPLPPDAHIVLLNRFDGLKGFFDIIQFERASEAVALIAQGVQVKDFRKALGLSALEGDALLFRTLHKRLITLHHRGNPAAEGKPGLRAGGSP